MTAATASVPLDPRITLFGAEWCSDCRRSKKVLDGLNVDYDYVDLEAVVDGADRAHAISGRTRIPVIVFPDASHLVEPSDADLRAKLAQFSVEA
ncbi:glutaredoxin domain-containing protein [Cryobacterium sp. GrIS_2_6]|uniref:glutaredoxin family protein n=1 Tax=Cryobacterium sp. GrIS_2_6 TaxID=3162785 RepID=UPI002E0C0312|nr:glutaredoxin domain-containing protein [Cryobacterium psychrotolerans]MEC5148490.1 glutaredoxin [Cryobacterium psychrotolerans]